MTLNFDDLMGDLRQNLLHRPEFRIDAPEWPVEMASALKDVADEPSAAPTNDGALDQNYRRLLANLSTGIWRLHERMNADSADDTPEKSLRRINRHVDSLWQTLQESQVEIIDHTNTIFDSGLSLRVIAFQPVDGINQEIVIETIKPTIYFEGRIIQMGEVIVGTPEHIAEPAVSAAPDDSQGDDSAIESAADDTSTDSETGATNLTDDDTTKGD